MDKGTKGKFLKNKSVPQIKINEKLQRIPLHRSPVD